MNFFISAVVLEQTLGALRLQLSQSATAVRAQYNAKHARLKAAADAAGQAAAEQLQAAKLEEARTILDYHDRAKTLARESTALKNQAIKHAKQAKMSESAGFTLRDSKGFTKKSFLLVGRPRSAAVRYWGSGTKDSPIFPRTEEEYRKKYLLRPIAEGDIFPADVNQGSVVVNRVRKYVTTLSCSNRGRNHKEFFPQNGCTSRARHRRKRDRRRT